MGLYDILNKISRSEFEEKVKQSKSYNSLLKTLGTSNHGLSTRVLRYKIKKEQIDVSHFTTKGVREHKSIYTNEEVFIENSTYNNNTLIKKRIFDNNLIVNECFRCKIKGGETNLPEMEGFCNILVLQLDHINGINNDNRLENLRLLCPNCHSQTKSFCGRNVKHKSNKCLDCNKKIDKRRKRCIDCYKKKCNNDRHKCLNCNKPIKKTSKRCMNCHKNFRKINNKETMGFEPMREISQCISSASL